MFIQTFAFGSQTCAMCCADIFKTNLKGGADRCIENLVSSTKCRHMRTEKPATFTYLGCAAKIISVRTPQNHDDRAIVGIDRQPFQHHH